MSFKSCRTPSSKLFASLKILKFEDMLHIQNTLFLHKLYHNKLPASVQNTFTVDFSHVHITRADKVGLINLPMVNSVSFGKNSIRFCSINSWNHSQILFAEKLFLTDFVALKSELGDLYSAFY